MRLGLESGVKRYLIIGGVALISVLGPNPIQAAQAYQQPDIRPAVYTGASANVVPVTHRRCYRRNAYVYRNQYVTRRYYSPRVVVKKRRFSHSAAIVGGSAAAGAAVGALAGGGKGAAIGALAGGGSGLVYDRLTHKKRVVVR